MKKFGTEQELFDFVTRSVIEQGAPSLDEGGKCVYRSKGGLKCAAGFLLDESEIIEGKRANCLPCMKQVSSDTLYLILDLQEAHDDASFSPEFVERFKTEARRVAKHRGLKATFV